MLDEAQALPDDVAALKPMTSNSRAEQRNHTLPIETLKYQLAGLRRQGFGSVRRPSTSSNSDWRTKRAPAGNEAGDCLAQLIAHRP